MTPIETRISATPSPLVFMERISQRADSQEVSLPRPEPYKHLYTTERIQEGVKYVDQRLSSTTKKPPPILSKLLVTYRAACEAYLSEPGDSTGRPSKASLLSEIRTYEQEMVNDSWFKDLGDEETHQFKESLLLLRRYQYYARYGDYAQRLCQQLRLQSSSDRFEGWRTLSSAHSRQDISKVIRHEETIWNQPAWAHEPINCPTIYAVHRTCIALDADHKQMIAAIHTYADRNEILHNSIDSLLKLGEFQELAKIISGDLNDLSSIIPLELLKEEALMRAILLDLKKRWFDIPEIDNMQRPPSTWHASKELKKEIQLRQNPATKAAAITEHQNDALLGSIKLLRRNSRDCELIGQLLGNPQPGVLPKPGPQSMRTSKRRASSEITPAERKKCWRAISDHHLRGYDQFNSSLAMQRLVNSITATYRANYGSSPPPSPGQSPNADPPESPSWSFIQFPTPSSAQSPTSPLSQSPTSPPPSFAIANGPSTTSDHTSSSSNQGPSTEPSPPPSSA